MSKQSYIEYRQGRAAFRDGKPYEHSAPHAWKMGYLNAKQVAAPALKEDEEQDDED